jgi:hypothetical protein
MFCIYCNEREAGAREHYLPQCLGRFHNFEPLLDRLCDTCNQQIGGDLEREFCRRSPEAVLRSMHWIKGQRRGGQKKRQAHIYQPEKIGGRYLSFLARDPGSDRDILWQPDELPGTAKEISQVVILDAGDNAVEHIAIPAEITTGRELEEVLSKNRGAKAQVIAAPGEGERIRSLFAEIGVTVPMQRRTGGRVRQQFFAGQITPAYYRALAKIGFHYALKYIPTITGHEGAFRPLREFIRCGIGDAGQFLSSCDIAIKADGPPGHLLEAVANPCADIIVKMQFFAGCKTVLPRWRLALGHNPTALHVSQASAHFFAYAQDDDGSLTGAEVIRLCPFGESA